ncbi:MAG: TetR/AcrR family transcriptional regulator, partial [Spirochaetaceae bacterium]|nr:TetR/AcrR family transcriptional regulator [Spirochaetaceae bacterium]
MKNEKESTKEKILAQAFAQLSASARDGVSLSDIARSVGISKAAIFRHYADKNTLLRSMGERFFDDAAQGVRENLRGIRGRLKTRDVLTVFIRFLAAHTEYFGYIRRLCGQADKMEDVLAEEFGRRGIRFEKKTKKGGGGGGLWDGE